MRGWFGVIAWPVAALSGIGNASILGYILWARSLSGAAYAQADLGLFMILVAVGAPILVSSIVILLLGTLLRPPAIRLFPPEGPELLVLMLLANIGLVAVFWIYLLFAA
jgi:hypothetical protein